MKTWLLILLLICGISSAAPPESKPSGNSGPKMQQPDGTQNNPLFVQRKETDDDKPANAQEIYERKLNLLVQGHSLIMSAENLEATRKAADAAGLAATVGIVMAIIAGLQVIMFGLQLAGMKTSNETAAEAATAAKTAADAAVSQFNVSHRPWIKVFVYHTGDLTRRDDERWAIPLTFRVNNIGNTVAQNVYPHPAFHVGQGWVDDLRKHQAEVAETFGGTTEASRDHGLTIFPGESIEIPMTLTISEELMGDATKVYVGIDYLSDCLPPLYIVGSVHYTANNLASKYRTGFIRELAYITENPAPNKRILIPKQHIVPAGNLALNIQLTGDGCIE